jgi:peptide/nickel transport system substrate-binding protein
VHYDFNFGWKPELAESWEISSDGLTYTFHLVRNATWHDGVKFTSADVKFSFEEIIYKYHPSGKVFLKQLDHIETPDDYTVVFKMKTPYPAFNSYLQNSYATIMAKHLYEGTNITQNPYNLNPIGTGPFKFKEFVSGDHVTLVRNENYWRKDALGRQLPYLDKVIFKIIPGAAERTLALEKGEVDLLLSDIPMTDFARLTQNSHILTSTRGKEAFADVFMLVFNLRNPILSKLEVRKAIAYAIDRQQVINLAFFGYGKPLYSWISAQIPWAFRGAIEPQYEYNLSKANQLLDDAGYPRKQDGTRFSIEAITNADLWDQVKLTEVLREQLKMVGIDFVPKPRDGATRNDLVYIKSPPQFDISVCDIFTGPDPNVGSARFLLSTQIGKGVITNCMGYNNSMVDELLNEAGSNPNVTKRADLFNEVGRYLQEDLPVLYISERADMMAWRDKYIGPPIGPWAYTEGLDLVYWTEGTEEPTSNVPSTGPSFDMISAAVVAVVIGVVVASGIYAVRRRRKPQKT